jgi:HAD superfamily hydrolase (TIGR01549 family)
MKILIWNCPWPSQGQPFFFENCCKEVLIPQANLLSKNNKNVYIAYSDFLEHLSHQIDNKVKKIELKNQELKEITGFADTLKELYSNPSGELTKKIANYLKKILPKDIDIILTWESPIPFLDILYKNALIIHQMPGCFSRPPYPKTITFDPQGLYRTAVVSEPKKVFDVILTENETLFGDIFCENVKKHITEIQPFTREDIKNNSHSDNLILLPLQISAHYAFYEDSGFNDQFDLLTNVLNNADAEQNKYIVTQYKSSFTSERPINTNNCHSLSKRWPSLIWKENFDSIPFPSQLLLPTVDGVIGFTSSVIFQAMAWKKNISIIANSYYKDYETKTDKDIERNRKVVDFIINRYQPLVEAITEDDKFLNNLLKKMHALKKSGKEGIELCVPFVEIDPNYSKRLINQFDSTTIIGAISRVNPTIMNRFGFIDKFRKMVSKKTVKYISFDLFDTLITRPLEHPSAIFNLLQSECKKKYKINLSDFYRIRVWAEAKARKESKKEEIDISDIYSIIKDYYALTQEDTEKIENEELEIELKLIKPRALGQQLWEIAKTTDKKIIIVTDMYLPTKTVRQMIKKCGFGENVMLFLSNQEQLTKRTGSLFKKILKEFAISGEEIVHIGDNQLTDIKSAENLKIKTFFVPSAMGRFHKNKIYSSLFPERIKEEQSKNILVGLIANNLFSSFPEIEENTTLFSGKQKRLGYAGLGPLYVGFAQWLQREASRDKIVKLYFLSREGFILKQVFDILFPEDTSKIKTEYLYCSRRAVGVASLKNKEDITALAGIAFANGTSLKGLLIQRFGITVNISQEEQANILNEYGINIDYLVSNVETKIWFVKFCLSVSSEILKNATKERLCYREYLQNKDFINSPNVAVVDVGWKGNMQENLSKFRSNLSLHGYYFATLSGCEKNTNETNTMISYIGDRVGSNHNNTLLDHRKMFELLTCHTDKSLCKMQKIKNQILPVYSDEEDINNRVEVIKEIHNSVKEFANDYKNNFGDIDNFALIDYSLSSRIFSHFICKPELADIQMLKNLSFEDAFAGVKKIKFADELNVLWIEALNVIKSNNDNKNISQATNNVNSKLDIANKDVEQNGFVQKLEKILVKATASDKKFLKYERSRSKFWHDSKSIFAKMWIRLNQIN